MIKGMAVLIMAFVFIVMCGCASVREIDEETGAIKEETKKVPCWDVDEHEDKMLSGLKKNGKVNVITIKTENKMVSWVLGAIMGLGGLGIVSGVIWCIYNIAYLGGKYIKSGVASVIAGFILFCVAYLFMEYLWVILTALGVATVGFVVWLVWYLNDHTEVIQTAVNTVEIAKGGGDKDAMRTVQGKHQTFFSKMKDKYVK